ncbi:MAG: glycosyltransferase, partial [Candidatus Bathyarchaeia archaeon]
MNICLITIKSVFPPDHGANVRIYKTAEFLGKRGNNVHLLILNPHHPRFPKRSNVPREQEVDIHPNVMVHWFRMHPNPLAFLLKSLSVPFAYPFLNLDTYIKLIEIVRDQSIDVIDSIYLSTALPALAVGRAFNIPVVITEEDLEYKVFLRERLYLNIPHNPVWLSMRGRMEAKLCNMCDHVVSVSEDDKRNLRRMGVHKPISVVPNATDTKTLRPDLDGSEVRRRYGVED